MTDFIFYNDNHYTKYTTYIYADRATCKVKSYQNIIAATSFMLRSLSMKPIVAIMVLKFDL